MQSADLFISMVNSGKVLKSRSVFFMQIMDIAKNLGYAPVTLAKFLMQASLGYMAAFENVYQF